MKFVLLVFALFLLNGLFFAQSLFLPKECNHPIIISKQDTSKTEIHTITRLNSISDDLTYGTTGENPVKVGTGPNGGPANQRAYLNLLRDSKGNPIQYERTGTCCMYSSPNGLMGFALVDVYLVRYRDAKGRKKKMNLYLSFYDYEDPKVIYGFKTI